MSKRITIALPPSLAPRGLVREEAAAYLGIGTTLFDDMVKAGELPPAKKLRGAVRWDRMALDRAFENLPSNGPERADAGEDNPWSDQRA